MKVLLNQWSVALLVFTAVGLAGCTCNDTSAGWFGSVNYTECNMGCLKGKSCGCTPNCPCHKKGCSGSCSKCQK